MNDFWQHCSALLERELTPQQYVTWIKPLAPVAFDAAANTLQIAAPNRFKLDWVKSQFSGRIADLARDFWQMPVDVQFVLDPKAGMRTPVAASGAVMALIDFVKLKYTLIEAGRPFDVNTCAEPSAHTACACPALHC